MTLHCRSCWLRETNRKKPLSHCIFFPSSMPIQSLKEGIENRRGLTTERQIKKSAVCVYLLELRSSSFFFMFVEYVPGTFCHLSSFPFLRGLYYTGVLTRGEGGGERDVSIPRWVREKKATFALAPVEGPLRVLHLPFSTTMQLKKCFTVDKKVRCASQSTRGEGDK